MMPLALSRCVALERRYMQLTAHHTPPYCDSLTHSSLSPSSPSLPPSLPLYQPPGHATPARRRLPHPPDRKRPVLGAQLLLHARPVHAPTPAPVLARQGAEPFFTALPCYARLCISTALTSSHAFSPRTLFLSPSYRPYLPRLVSVGVPVFLAAADGPQHGGAHGEGLQPGGRGVRRHADGLRQRVNAATARGRGA